ncbi:MAG: PIN domain protein [Candidatus Methanoperedens nitroreducens]|uniref:PIN domain protein n=1 Tax=Candidatus Methanoperedens nitratireducens TaxID=1392998 RepID=A0A0P7ZA86_9EURY|nr:PIN domain-containing protein [Candidatus Methanoperedens sp. BLZ2]KAB2945515.1 MAG: type II toxin-antitoxin system VapC family toxin [Candidatus Methanoperedens sp.]KPQ41365.1 MAG: PIN domain protein [Candidatus Methanoperedens sp. BLZ1]MBZ0174765.1 PIN domain-containing protein [Candidatus Methanoperedens nitroreducens]MCX9080110.1 PIN domain-containing protein [Candidatus Methanoperedens sp.]
MKKILLDTMIIYDILTEENKAGPYHELSQAIEDEKITGVVSVITLTEIINFLGDIYKEKINGLLSSKLDIIDIDRTIAIRGGEFHRDCGLSTGDTLIAATGVLENVKHILTDDTHFDDFKYLKKINLKTALKMAR